MKLKELNDIKGSIARLLVAPNISAKVAYRATKFSKKLAKEIDDLEEQRVALVRKYGVEENGNYRVPPSRLPEFEAEFNQLLEEEVEIPVLRISVDELEKAGLTMLDFANLDFLIEEPKKE